MTQRGQLMLTGASTSVVASICVEFLLAGMTLTKPFPGASGLSLLYTLMVGATVGWLASCLKVGKLPVMIGTAYTGTAMLYISGVFLGLLDQEGVGTLLQLVMLTAPIVLGAALGIAPSVFVWLIRKT